MHRRKRRRPPRPTPSPLTAHKNRGRVRQRNRIPSPTDSLAPRLHVRKPSFQATAAVGAQQAAPLDREPDLGATRTHAASAVSCWLWEHPLRWSRKVPREAGLSRGSAKAMVLGRKTKAAKVAHVMISSAGGTGTNALNWRLHEHGILAGFGHAPYQDFMVHALAPSVDDSRYLMPPTRADLDYIREVRRGIFLYRDPCLQLHSMLRRNFTGVNFAKRLHLWPPSVESWMAFPPEHWEVPSSLDQVLELDRDTMLLEEQWLAWTTPNASRTFPVLAIKFSALFDEASLAEVDRFIGHDLDDPLRERKSGHPVEDEWLDRCRSLP